MTAYSGKVEYGQGIRSGFTRAIAKELDVDPFEVDVVLGDTASVPFDRGTTGSASTRTVGLQLRRAAATARRELIDLAAGRRKTKAGSDLGTAAGAVVAADGRTLPYGDLLGGVQRTVNVMEGIVLKTSEPPAHATSQRTDAGDRVTGRARYSRDVVLPGMLHARVLRPPSYGAKLVQLDTARAERVPGVIRVVSEPGLVAVVAEREDVAEHAVSVLRARWEESRSPQSDWNLPALLKDSAQTQVVLREEGSLGSGLNRAAHVIEGTYFVPYVANAQMEPRAAVAQWDGDQLTVWCGNRGPFSERSYLAKTLGIDETRIRVIAAEIGGSFGTKSSTVGYEAARVARTVQRPVRVTYSRSDEFSWSTVRPAALIEIRSGVDNDGRIVAWEHVAYHAGENAFRGRRGADTPYAIDNVRIAVANTDSPFSSGSYRSVGGAVNHFAREVHMDEIATRLEIDPLELRMKNLKHPRFRRVLQSAAERFEWSARTTDRDYGGGLAVGFDAGSYVAECAEVEVARRDLKVRRVVAAFDCGEVLNPDGVKNQVEGSIVMGIGTALWEAVEFDGGRVLNPGFGRYRMPRIADTPEIEVVLIDDPSNPPTGAGEPAIVPIAAAVSIAVRRVTGSRVESLPIVPQLPG